MVSNKKSVAPLIISELYIQDNMIKLHRTFSPTKVCTDPTPLFLFWHGPSSKKSLLTTFRDCPSPKDLQILRNYLKLPALAIYTLASSSPPACVCCCRSPPRKNPWGARRPLSPLSPLHLQSLSTALNPKAHGAPKKKKERPSELPTLSLSLSTHTQTRSTPLPPSSRLRRRQQQQHSSKPVGLHSSVSPDDARAKSPSSGI